MIAVPSQHVLGVGDKNVRPAHWVLQVACWLWNMPLHMQSAAPWGLGRQQVDFQQCMLWWWLTRERLHDLRAPGMLRASWGMLLPGNPHFKAIHHCRVPLLVSTVAIPCFSREAACIICL